LKNLETICSVILDIYYKFKWYSFEYLRLV